MRADTCCVDAIPESDSGEGFQLEFNDNSSISKAEP